jgi:hypothetical protein
VPPGNNTFGGGTAETVLGTGVLVIMLVSLVVIFLVPRKYVMAPLMFGVFLVPAGETLVLGGVHLFVSRILILAGLIRVICSRWSQRNVLNHGYTSIDKVFTVRTIVRAVAFVLIYMEMGAVVNQVGFLWDALGGFFLMRLLIGDDLDVRRTIKILCGVAIVLSATMLYEKFTSVNVYGLIAGHSIVPEIRNGSIRAQGPFHHAILAGTFGATLLPLFVWLWRSKKDRFLAVLGMGASTAITFCSASSTPVSAFLAGILGICLWPLRSRMRTIRWGLVAAVLLLNIVMHAPVWWALEHVDLAGGSAGEHRAELLDNFVRHFGDWWLIGTKDNANWGFEMWDLSNQYIAEGELGGIIPFACLVIVITLAFKKLGRARKAVRGDREKEWYFWLLGAALFSHTVAFFGISYFDQTEHAWFALLAMIVAATACCTQGSVPNGRVHGVRWATEDVQATVVAGSDSP